MRLRRMVLRDFRGVTESDVVLLDDERDAVTIVQGPNEVGKTSLVEALDLLFRRKHDSTAQDVDAVRPRGRDADPEVVAEIETGPYVFAYRKRFATTRHGLTELEITAPAHEQLTGGEAHDRAEAILAETIDVDLWEALRIVQGAELDRVELAAARSLATALESTSPATAIGERELDLLQRVRDEHQTYFTKAGGPRKLIVEARERVEGAERTRDDLAAKLDGLESDIERIAALERDLPERERHLAESEARVGELEDALAEVADLERTRKEHASALEAAETRVESTAERHRTREELATRERVTAERLPELERNAAATAEELDGAAATLADAREALEDARKARRETEQRAELRRRDVDHLDDVRELARLTELQERLTGANETIAQATATIERIRVTDELLERLRDADRQVAIAANRVDVATPELTVEAEDGPVTVEVDDEETEVTADGPWSRRASEPVTLRFPGTARVTVDPGERAEDATAALDEAQRAHRALLDEAGVDDLDAAEEALRRRRDAEARRTAAEAQREEALGERSVDELETELATRRERIADHAGQRPDDPPLPSDVDEARRLRDEADSSLEQARATEEEAAREHERARDRHEQLREASHTATVELRLAREEAERVRDRLAAERAETPDDELAEALTTARTEAEEAEEALRAAESRLEEASPDEVRTLADNARATVASARDELRAAQDELVELRARVGERGGEGLFDQHAEAEAELERARADLRALERRAAAAERLHASLERHHAAARERYVGPLREQIVRLGRILHGADFDVELDEELRIARRTLDGLTLDFEDLSHGAKEQLDLIARLACSILIADDGGGPLIVDDTLGSADPDRLERMGAILRTAGKHCQVIVLTCYPDRYRHVGGARVVQLSG